MYMRCASRNHLDFIEFLRLRIGIVEKSRSARTRNEAADGLERLEQVRRGQHLVIHPGRTVPDDQLVVVRQTGDCQRRRDDDAARVADGRGGVGVDDLNEICADRGIAPVPS